MERRQQLQTWIAAEFPGRAFELAPASADASFRRYFRLTFADDPVSLIVMDAPPSHEDCRPYIKVAELLGAAGVHVPQIIKQNLEQGFLLLSDLGSTTYLQALTKDNAHNLYAEALGALMSIQLSSKPGVLPEYNRELLLREMELFPVWYVSRHKGLTLTDKQAQQLYEVFDRVLDVNLSEPKVYVHRDYHSRNLMQSTPNPGVLDFQDAVYGPLTYDLVSLLKDAYVHWDEDFTLDLLARYWETARSLGLPVREDFADFHRDYEYMGVQRHIKVLGIFARLYHRDGKDGYLKDMPLVLHYLRKTCERYGELKPLLRILEQTDPTVTEVGYSF
ncbi:aminoglycoside phosphotransferase family protein [Zoogloea sp. LCSB751]|uniref:aminoglycoside phosphotransferase family protein n=1 Tax=Zoogloea sp. LCSB751 TaxID=1965277 RepID=UPI0009A4DF40|nr:phosphotransferase [Zoogloea sp. LCSB751]